MTKRKTRNTRKRPRGRPKLRSPGVLPGADYIAGSAIYNAMRAAGVGYDAAIEVAAKATHCSGRTFKKRLAQMQQGDLKNFFWEGTPSGPSLVYGLTPPPPRKKRNKHQ